MTAELSVIERAFEQRRSLEGAQHSLKAVRELVHPNGTEWSDRALSGRHFQL